MTENNTTSRVPSAMPQASFACCRAAGVCPTAVVCCFRSCYAAAIQVPHRRHGFLLLLGELVAEHELKHRGVQEVGLENLT